MYIYIYIYYTFMYIYIYIYVYNNMFVCYFVARGKHETGDTNGPRPFHGQSAYSN